MLYACVREMCACMHVCVRAHALATCACVARFVRTAVPLCTQVGVHLQGAAVNFMLLVAAGSTDQSRTSPWFTTR